MPAVTAPLIALGLGGLAIWALTKKPKPKPVKKPAEMPEELWDEFMKLLEEECRPEELDRWAGVFDAEGFEDEADILRGRGAEIRAGKVPECIRPEELPADWRKYVGEDPMVLAQYFRDEWVRLGANVQACRNIDKALTKRFQLAAKMPVPDGMYGPKTMARMRTYIGDLAPPPCYFAKPPPGPEEAENDLEGIAEEVEEAGAL